MILNSNNTPFNALSTARKTCGTLAGYSAHTHKKETVCEPCRIAYREYSREYKKRKYYENLEESRKKQRERSQNWNNKNKEKRKEIWKKYNDKTKEKRSKWYEENKETILQKRQDYREKNREFLREKHRDYYRNKCRKRRAQKRNNSYEKYTDSQVLDLYGTDCHICGQLIDLSLPRAVGAEGWQMGLHIDHVIPIAAGGPDILENVRPAHAICNMKKGARMDFEPEIDPDLFDEDLIEEIENEFALAEDYDDHYNDEEALEEEEE